MRTFFRRRPILSNPTTRVDKYRNLDIQRIPYLSHANLTIDTADLTADRTIDAILLSLTQNSLTQNRT